jgi:hypothetical protein
MAHVIYEGMKSLLPWLTLFFTFALVACGDDEPPGNPPRDATTDSAPEDRCQGSAPIGCEEVVGNADDCPTLDEVCEGVCGASYDCCYCGGDGQWQVLYTDCPQCPDAGNSDAGGIGTL